MPALDPRSMALIRRLAVFLALECLALPRQAFAQAAHLQKVRTCLLDPGCAQMIVTAHRQGYSGPFENTLWAFRQNLGKDMDMLEFDVRQTKDGALVVMHDDKVDELTAGTGEVSKMTLAEFKRLRIKGLRAIGIDEAPPTFEEVAQIARGNFFLMIHVLDASVEKIWREAKQFAVADQAVLFVSNAGEYWEIERLLSSGEDVLFMPRYHKSWLPVGWLIDSFSRAPRFVHIDAGDVDAKVVSDIRVRGAKPYIGIPACQSPQDCRAMGEDLMRQGVTMFETDQALDMVQALPDYR